MRHVIDKSVHSSYAKNQNQSMVIMIISTIQLKPTTAKHLVSSCQQINTIQNYAKLYYVLILFRTKSIGVYKRRGNLPEVEVAEGVLHGRGGRRQRRHEGAVSATALARCGEPLPTQRV